jgi:hypothetical protein
MRVAGENVLVPGRSLLAFTSMLSNPADTLGRLKDRPQWFFPLLVTAAYSVIVNMYVIGRIGLPRLIQATLQANAAFDPQSTLETALARKGLILTMQGLSTSVGTFVTALVVAQVLWLILSTLGREPGFKPILAVVAHASMLTGLLKGSMLALTVTLMQNMESFDLRNPLATNPAFFFRPASAGTSRLMAALDLIVLLQIALLALGLSRVTGGLTFRRAFLLVSIPWAFYTGISVALPL